MRYMILLVAVEAKRAADTLLFVARESSLWVVACSTAARARCCGLREREVRVLPFDAKAASIEQIERASSVHKF